MCGNVVILYAILCSLVSFESGFNSLQKVSVELGAALATKKVIFYVKNDIFLPNQFFYNFFLIFFPTLGHITLEMCPKVGKKMRKQFLENLIWRKNVIFTLNTALLGFLFAIAAPSSTETFHRELNALSNDTK
jgi:hypothetical protein